MPARLIDRRFGLCLGAVWLACIAIELWVQRDSIAALRFPDIDDAMRLLEVRDWIGGQSWFDVSQHRLDPPIGFSMHWSRLVDVPIAAIIVALRPMVGESAAETMALAIVPMLTLGAVMALVAGFARRQIGAGFALLGAAFCLVDYGTFYALPPLRIDHHGWELVGGLGIAVALAGSRDPRRAIAAGLCAGLWTNISIEGLAFTAGAAAWLGLRWIADPARERTRLPVFLASLSTTALTLYLAIHGTLLIGRTFCDAISPVHIAVFAIAAGLTAIATRLEPATWLFRALLLGIAGLASGATYALWAPQCLAGPFGMLDPLALNLWYRKIAEGLPIWHAGWSATLLWIVYPLVGLTGGLCAWRKAHDTSRREAWLDYAALLGVATVIGALVLRAGALSNLLAIPGALWMLAAAIRRAAGWRAAFARAAATVLALLLLNPVASGIVMVMVPVSHAREKPPGNPACRAPRTFAPLAGLGRATVMAPLDSAPMMLAASSISAVGSGYHRNVAAIDDVLRFFTVDEASARAVLARHHAGAVAFCPGEPDLRRLAAYAPDGLAARLLQRRPPAWLQPLPVPDPANLRVYAVR